jgi:hypothetical protein
MGWFSNAPAMHAADDDLARLNYTGKVIGKQRYNDHL